MTSDAHFTLQAKSKATMIVLGNLGLMKIKREHRLAMIEIEELLFYYNYDYRLPDVNT